MKFVDWCPTGIKVGLTNVPMNTPSHFIIKNLPRTLTKLENNTGLKAGFMDNLDKFCELFNKCAYLVTRFFFL